MTADIQHPPDGTDNGDAAGPVPIGDTRARSTIVAELGRTLFVEAGAGSGKTQSLVDRFVATVMDPESAVPLRQVAAVTFTEKAAVELRDRVRGALEIEAMTARAGSPAAQRAEAALEDLDEAAIGTLHSFAQRVLSEHPIEAGLPPKVEVLDEVSSGIAFDDRWTAQRAAILDDDQLAPALLLALAAGMRLDDLRSMMRTFTENWDLIQERIIDSAPPGPTTLSVEDLLDEARRLVVMGEHCVDDTDRFLGRLDVLRGWADSLERAPDDPARLTVLGAASDLKWGYGAAGNWHGCDLQVLRAQCSDLARRAVAAGARVLEPALRTIARSIGQTTLAAAQARRADGRLEFHDLLVMARDLLRSRQHGHAVRETLHTRYRRLLLDEFQDTDPIQVELAVRIAAGVDGDAPDWTDITVPDASLFIVGDPKQSIYRFRRADIATYLHAQQRLGDSIMLDTNFRTTAPIVAWINHVFDRLITASPGSQPAYQPLHAVREAAPGGPAVAVIGAEAHDAARAGGRLSADELRTEEAADVIATIRIALAEQWPVYDTRAKRWRPVEARDIAVLVPARTSLPHLEAAFDAAGIAYHAEASSLVYRTREVRDLLLAARAVDDPSDPLTLVETLRSVVFGCGDDDLWTWQKAGGRWNILAPTPQNLPGDHPVVESVACLRRLHDDRVWLAPSEVLSRIVAERRTFELATSEPRTRDIWRRLRFVVDQARAWSEAQHGGLRAYLTWAERQGGEAGHVTEAVLPETDTDTIRVMTIHAAKGLEFPVVILSGLSSRQRTFASGIEVLWPPGGGCEFKLRRDVQTSDFDAVKPVDEQMGHHERLRLLYVACTRARDHLVVSLHRNERAASGQPPEDEKLTNAELLAQVCRSAPNMVALSWAAQASHGAPRLPADATPGDPGTRPGAAAGRGLVDPPPPQPSWQTALTHTRRRAARPAAMSASSLEGTLAAASLRPTPLNALGEPIDAGLAKSPRDLELPPWNKGRYGTAIGRAVHGVLQSVDLATGDGLDDAVAAQTFAEGVGGHVELVAQLARAALSSDVVRQAAARPHWRETYVGTMIGDQVLEGIIDLLYRDERGLVIVDYKTDAAPPAALGARVDFYRPQMAAYALAIEAATGQTASRCVLIFLSPGGAHARDVDGLHAAVAQVRDALTQ